MAEFEKTEFVFPDEAEASTDIEVAKPETESSVKEAPKKAEPEVKVEVVDDRPPEDRNKKASKAPDELTEDELESYSEKVRKRIQHFSKGYHDQRRAAESAQRERDEALRIAQQVLEENNNLKGTVNKSQSALLEQAKRVATSELEEAKRAYKTAYESFDADAVVSAQEALTAAKIKADRINNIKLPSLQAAEKGVKQQPIAPAAPRPDERALAWQAENNWFGADDEMTSFALGLHQKLVKQGVNPQSDDYYEKINSRMRQVFPDQFDAVEDAPEEPRTPQKRSSVVAPATRTTAPKKVVLTKTQVALAKRLGLPLEVYARQVAEDMRKQNG